MSSFGDNIPFLCFVICNLANWAGNKPALPVFLAEISSP